MTCVCIAQDASEAARMARDLQGDGFEVTVVGETSHIDVQGADIDELVTGQLWLVVATKHRHSDWSN